jgi:hypothetical protein
MGPVSNGPRKGREKFKKEQLTFVRAQLIWRRWPAILNNLSWPLRERNLTNRRETVGPPDHWNASHGSVGIHAEHHSVSRREVFKLRYSRSRRAVSYGCERFGVTRLLANQLREPL